LLNVLVDRRVFFDIGIGTRNVGLWLIVVVVRNKILDGILREKLTHLAIKLGGQRFVRRENDGRSLYFLDDAGDRERLAGSRNTEQRLSCKAVIQTFNQSGNRLRLIAGRIEFGHQRQTIAFIDDCFLWQVR